jgi:hypothetical protein
MQADVDLTAWSHGQITAKLWLAQVLEDLYLEDLYKNSDSMQIAFYGGWYGLAPFLLLSRNYLPIKSIRSFDINPKCEKIADAINTAWVYEDWKFKAVTADVNSFNWYDEHDWIPDLVVNTSIEHFQQDDWFYSLVPNMCVAIQGNNQQHEDHTACINSMDELKNRFKMRNILYEGRTDYNYPDKQYTRFMLVGYR